MPTSEHQILDSAFVFAGIASESRFFERTDKMYEAEGPFHGRNRLPEKLLQQVNTQLHHCRNRWPTHRVGWSMLCDQSQQLSPRAHQIHLIQNARLHVRLVTSLNPVWARPISFMNDSTVSDQPVTGLTFADLPSAEIISQFFTESRVHVWSDSHNAIHINETPFPMISTD